MFNHYFSLVISVVDGLELLPIDIIALERNRQFRTMFMDGKRPERQFHFVLNARLVVLFLLRRDICTKVRPEIRFEACAE